VDFKVREDLAERLLQNLEPSDWSAMVTCLAEKMYIFQDLTRETLRMDVDGNYSWSFCLLLLFA